MAAADTEVFSGGEPARLCRISARSAASSVGDGGLVGHWSQLPQTKRVDAAVCIKLPEAGRASILEKTLSPLIGWVLMDEP